MRDPGKFTGTCRWYWDGGRAKSLFKWKKGKLEFSFALKCLFDKLKKGWGIKIRGAFSSIKIWGQIGFKKTIWDFL